MNGEVYTPMTQLAAAVKHLWIIGRHPGCDLMINERTVSNNHAHIRCDAGKWYIRDLGSSNGTFQYLHTRFTLGGDSEELLVQEENRVFLDEKDISLLVSFSLS
jgi:predicted component of type VI protein secretion system